MKSLVRIASFLSLAFLIGSSAIAQPFQRMASPPPGGIPRLVLLPGSSETHSMFSDYIANVVVYMLLVAFLVTILLVGAMLILSLGLMSRRPEDRIGGRTPSDMGILKQGVWPEAPYDKNTLPADDEQEPDQAA